jgi:hypothetical protein
MSNKSNDLITAERQRAIYGISSYVYRQWKAHRDSAKRREVPFRFSLLAWHCWWNAELIVLGPDAKRGRRRGEYVMARYGDRGAYEPGNVYAATPGQNNADKRADVVELATSMATATRARNGVPRGYNLKIRGDGHPKAKAVMTDAGRFGSIALAAEAHVITRAGGHYRVRSGTWRFV